MQRSSKSTPSHTSSRLDQFLFVPFVAATATWLIAVAPTAFNTIGLFPSPWLILGMVLTAAIAVWGLFRLIRTVRDRLWRQAVSVLVAALIFIAATWACFAYRTEVLVTVSIWRIQAQMAGLTPTEVARFKTNRGISDGDGTPFVLVVYDGSDADMPEPGKSEKIWTSYDWLITGTIQGCKIVSRPLGGHFYLQTICVKDD
jgi:hypothetical protein